MLSKLEDLRIHGCKRLEYVFPVFVATGLMQLKNLEIEDTAELKQVFHGKEENDVAEEGKDIKLPNLKKLNVYKLGKLTRFFPENNHSNLPALEKLCDLSVTIVIISLLTKFSLDKTCFFKNLKDYTCYLWSKSCISLEDLILKDNNMNYHFQN
ncbi:uncharacterized protein LOC116127116 [Pistacia vera]|uniref:uncharacterized protein LOC116127116 n=1 Tax=Pistacia vera TaxID=55513 RepID=UPI001263262C|nr:uncharacterized protein LOC116127116 [Pistacia vera]